MNLYGILDWRYPIPLPRNLPPQVKDSLRPWKGIADCRSLEEARSLARTEWHNLPDYLHSFRNTLLSASALWLIGSGDNVFLEFDLDEESNDIEYPFIAHSWKSSGVFDVDTARQFLTKQGNDPKAVRDLPDEQVRDYVYKYLAKAIFPSGYAKSLWATANRRAWIFMSPHTKSGFRAKKEKKLLGVKSQLTLLFERMGIPRNALPPMSGSFLAPNEWVSIEERLGSYLEDYGKKSEVQRWKGATAVFEAITGDCLAFDDTNEGVWVVNAESRFMEIEESLEGVLEAFVASAKQGRFLDSYFYKDWVVSK